MAGLTRDHGIQFPSDEAMTPPNSPLLSRQMYNYLSRGSTFKRNFQTLGSGIPLQLGIRFFGQLLPNMALGQAAEIPYAPIIDVRKTKVIDTIKEALLGSPGNEQPSQTSLTSLMDLDIVDGDSQSHINLHTRFNARILSQQGGFPGGGKLHEWEEVAWDPVSTTFVGVVDGYSSNGIPGKRAIHAPSKGLLAVSGQPIVQITLVKTTNGPWIATFEASGATEVLAAKVTGVSGPTNATYDAEAIVDATISVSGSTPMNRGIVGVDYLSGSVFNLCLLIWDNDFQNYGLLIFGEQINTTACQPGFPTGAELSAGETMRQIALNTAIGSAI